jgi:glycolate oxidase FAD binding subunit
MAQAIDQFKQQILDAAASKRSLRLRGGGTKDWYGQQLAGELLDTRSHSGIVAYEPTELVITARCGTPLAEIEAALQERGQMLAFEPPHFGEAATFGGAIASGLAGPRRATSGGVRDFVLGCVMMDGRGEVQRFGGQVMKNVAGYDVSRLMAGSMGTLGLMLEHSIKVLPHPNRETSLRMAMPEIDAIRRMNEWGGQPLPISATCWHAGQLTVRLSGAQAAVDDACKRLGGDLVPDGRAFWNSLREHEHQFFADSPSLWRLSVPAPTGAIVLGGEQLIEWGGAQRWLRSATDGAGAERIRKAVAAVGGHATLFRGGDKAVGVFHPLLPAVARIEARLREAFDPHHVFNPGRMG